MIIMKKSLLLIFAVVFVAKVSNAQTLIIDYSEDAKTNTASIHLIESKLPIESEYFDDITKAKTKLVRTIENYHTDGYRVNSSNVSTHKSGRSLHYHYQYILQKDWVEDAAEETGKLERRERVRERLEDGSGQVRVNTSEEKEKREQRNKAILEDGKGQPRMVKQPLQVE